MVTSRPLKTGNKIYPESDCPVLITVVSMTNICHNNCQHDTILQEVAWMQLKYDKTNTECSMSYRFINVARQFDQQMKWCCSKMQLHWEFGRSQIMSTIHFYAVTIDDPVKLLDWNTLLKLAAKQLPLVTFFDLSDRLGPIIISVVCNSHFPVLFQICDARRRKQPYEHTFLWFSYMLSTV